jgi:hypothetical protein
MKVLQSFRSERRRLYSQIATSINSFRTSVLCFVASVCSTIARCISLTHLNYNNRNLKAHGCRSQFIPPINSVGFLATRR